jgi:hypothetical protein
MERMVETYVPMCYAVKYTTQCICWSVTTSKGSSSILSQSCVSFVMAYTSFNSNHCTKQFLYCFYDSAMYFSHHQGATLSQRL